MGETLNEKELLNGGYLGLVGEVITEDCYKLKQLPFVPDIIFDFGANVGTFARHSRSLFPNALIVSVEPDSSNHELFNKLIHDDNTLLLNKAIGTNKGVFRVKGAANGAGEVYLSVMTGYATDFSEDEFIKTDIDCVTVEDVILAYLEYKHDKVLVKIDIEGSENSIFEHEPSMSILREMDYVTMEIHRYALTGGKEQESVNELTEKALKSFEETHNCIYEHPLFYAIKKPLKLK